MIDSLPGEIWKKDILIGADHVFVSSLGRVRLDERQTVARNSVGIMAPRTFPARICSTYVDGKGYAVVTIRHAGAKRNYKVHRLVCAAFHGPPPPDRKFACHANGSRLDNRPDNLKWGSPIDNAADTIRHGRHRVGSQKKNTKLNETSVVLIKRRLREGEKQRIVAEQFGVSRGVIAQISIGRTWRHVAI